MKAGNTGGIEGSRVAVVGGSIAGCAAAVALSRAGCSVSVYERSRGGLRDRGAGMSIPVSVRDDLVAAGYLDPAMPTRHQDALVWRTRDGRDPAGRLLGRQGYPSLMVAWTMLWRSLRARVPEGCYHEATPVTAIRSGTDGVTLVVGGAAERFDVVVGADGFRSRIRGLVAPEARLRYGGYGLWRGDFPARRLPATALTGLAADFTAVGFTGGHGVFYLIPESGRLRQNWAVYCEVPRGVYPGAPAPVPRGFLPPGAVDHFRRWAARRLPPVWADVVRMTEPGEMSLHPMYDVHVSAYTAGRLLLIGDAGALARPHTGAGALKALEDASALEAACGEGGSWEHVLARYDAQRCTAGNALTDLGMHLGRMRVEQAPDWGAMTSRTFETWVRANTEGWRSQYDPN